jgi:HAD superfamily hydrolase (TIGR01509 family)
MIRALIFDFDGLILDTESPEYQSWQETFQAYGCEFPLDVWVQSIGTANLFDPYALLAERCGRAVDAAEVRVRRRARFMDLMAAQTPLPGVLEYLDEAKRRGLKLAVASSSSRSWVAGNLAQHGLDGYFDCIKCRDDVAAVKPDPALYLAALAGLDVRADEAIAFEDSPNGLLAARRAGLYCVVVPNGMTGTLPFDDPNLRLGALADLPLADLLASHHPSPYGSE